MRVNILGLWGMRFSDDHFMWVTPLFYIRLMAWSYCFDMDLREGGIDVGFWPRSWYVQGRVQVFRWGFNWTIRETREQQHYRGRLRLGA